MKRKRKGGQREYERLLLESCCLGGGRSGESGESGEREVSA